MAALEPYGDFIRELFDTGKTHDAISTALKQSGAPKCSVMTVRRFCVEHNLRRRNLVSPAPMGNNKAAHCRMRETRWNV